ncbi:LytR/AlgR family response regulator transcription factor [Pedobacter duraquae]|uniref:LytTR family two component transcriptional regulator n=1 Tax=Pedobacter duraquae TaxID=425511 RepID=A0A4R6IMP1_9SPHI|nr:LytTR family DNA-binding domain-containing protein [Pedobacter duraquae]TDO23276.1 LytTR family two component transcriptional regulator [Pedobacter duraquae]
MELTIYNVLIVDDEPPAREVLKRYVQKMPTLRLAGECGNGLEVIPFLHNNPVDIIFLDIRMPQLTGLELVSTLIDPPKIIFTTAYAEHALESYDLRATDYLLKPIHFDRFVKAVNKAIPIVSTALNNAVSANIEHKPADNFLYFRSDRKMVKVMINDILYIESLKDYVKIITISGQVITKYAMAALEATLPAPDFLRIHRSFIVAGEKIQSYTLSHVQIAGYEIPIGKFYQREVIKALEG